MNADVTRNKTVIFVEDNPAVQMAYRNCLEEEGFHIEPALDGLEAIKLLSRLVPELVILDLMLPKFSGADVLKFIHTHARFNKVPILILSTNSIPDAAQEYVLLRAHRRLLKDSCTPAILIQAVRELFAPSSASGNASSTASTPSAGAQMTKHRTLVFVEDNRVVSMAYRNRLEAGGFHVVPAEDGLEAMKILSQQVPDVVVLDLMLPKLSGVEVLKFICSNPRLNAVSVIILSNNSVIDVAEEYVLERAKKRLLKSSCTPAIMLRAIRELLDGPSAQDDASSDDPSGKPDNEKGLIRIRIGN